MNKKAFTLIEIMVTLVLTSFVVMGFYYITTATGENFGRKNAILRNTEQLRFASELLRRDIGRAGYRATLNSKIDPTICRKSTISTPEIYALLIKRVSTPPLPAYDQITITGDITDGAAFPVDRIIANNISLQTGSYFLAPDIQIDPNSNVETFVPKIADNTEILNIIKRSFTPPVALKITSPSGKSIFVQATSLVNNKITTKSLNLDQECGFAQHDLTGVQINPLVSIRYDLIQDPLDPQNILLRRCNIPLDKITAENIPDNLMFCDILVEGVTKFNALPLKSYVNPNDLGNSNTWSNKESFLSHTSINFKPEAIRAVMINIEARTTEPVKNMKLDPNNPKLQEENAPMTIVDGKAYDLSRIYTSIAVKSAFATP